MGGTDLHDWLLAQFRSSFRSRRWQPKVLVHMLQQAAVNAHLLFRLKHASPSSRTLYDFVNELLLEIPGFSRQEEVVHPAPGVFLAAINQSRWWWSQQHARRTTGNHIPAVISRPRCGNERQLETRKRCKYCMQILTNLYCTDCDVFLCGGDCWRHFHSDERFPNHDELLARQQQAVGQA